MRAPAPGDVVVFRSPEERRRLLVKRCVAVGGDSYRGGYVPAGTLGLEGDDAARSHDSRAFGPVGARRAGRPRRRRALVGRARRRARGLRASRTLARVR